MSIEDFDGTTPEIDLEKYFLGESRAYGMIFERSGKPKRSFVVDLVGSYEGDTFKLYEDFSFSDGEKQERTWYLKKTSDNTFEGRAADVVGVAIGKSNGNAINFSYTLQVEVDGSTWNIQLDDWMFMQEDGVLFNRATMSKFGFKVGEIVIFFQKPDAKLDQASIAKTTKSAE
jgi:hypothetical protein